MKHTNFSLRRVDVWMCSLYNRLFLFFCFFWGIGFFLTLQPFIPCLYKTCFTVDDSTNQYLHEVFCCVTYFCVSWTQNSTYYPTEFILMYDCLKRWTWKYSAIWKWHLDEPNLCSTKFSSWCFRYFILFNFLRCISTRKVLICLFSSDQKQTFFLLGVATIIAPIQQKWWEWNRAQTWKKQTSRLR